MTSLPSPLPPSLWSDTARRVAAVIALLALAGIGFGIGYLVFDELRRRRRSGADAGDRRHRKAGRRRSRLPAAGDPQHDPGRRGRPGRRRGRRRPGDLPHPRRGRRDRGGDDRPRRQLAGRRSRQRRSSPPRSGLRSCSATRERFRRRPRTPLTALSPKGLEKAAGTQAYVDRERRRARRPEGQPGRRQRPGRHRRRDRRRAREADRQKDPGHILVVSSTDSSLAMPAAAWAARSGDPILFADGDQVARGDDERRSRAIPTRRCSCSVPSRRSRTRP